METKSDYSLDKALAKARSKVEMNFGSFSSASLSVLMVTYAQHFSLLGQTIASTSAVSDRSGQLAGKYLFMD